MGDQDDDVESIMQNSDIQTNIAYDGIYKSGRRNINYIEKEYIWTPNDCESEGFNYIFSSLECEEATSFINIDLKKPHCFLKCICSFQFL